MAINGKAIGKGGIMLTEIFHNALTSISKFYFSVWYSISTTFDIKINLKMKFKIFTSLNVYQRKYNIKLWTGLKSQARGVIHVLPKILKEDCIHTHRNWLLGVLCYA